MLSQPDIYHQEHGDVSFPDAPASVQVSLLPGNNNHKVMLPIQISLKRRAGKFKAAERRVKMGSRLWNSTLLLFFFSFLIYKLSLLLGGGNF